MTTTSQSCADVRLEECALAVQRRWRFVRRVRSLERFYGDDVAFVCFMFKYHHVLEFLLAEFHQNHPAAPLDVVMEFLHGALTTPGMPWPCRGSDDVAMFLQLATQLAWMDGGGGFRGSVRWREDGRKFQHHNLKEVRPVELLKSEWRGLDAEGVSTWDLSLFEFGHMVWEYLDELSESDEEDSSESESEYEGDSESEEESVDE